MDPEHPDHLQLFDLIMKMLNYDPRERVTLAEALNHPFFSVFNGRSCTTNNGNRERSHSLSR